MKIVFLEFNEDITLADIWLINRNGKFIMCQLANHN